MPDSAYLTAELTGWIALFMVVIARLGLVVFLMPGIGEQTVPMRVRGAVMIAVATAFAASGIVPRPQTEGFAAFFGLMLSEASLPFTQIQGFLIESILLVSRTGCKKQSETNGREAG